MKQEIRILQITMGDSFRGAEKLILDVFRNIDSNIKFDFLCTKNIYKNYEKEINKLGGNIYSLNVKRNNIINKIKYSRKIKEFLKNNRYDCIHINTSAFFYALNVCMIAKKYGVKKVILHVHNTPKINKFKKMIINVLNPLLMSKVDISLACSNDAKKSVYKDDNNVTILNNGIDIDKFKYNENLRKKYRKEYNLDNKVVYGHVGSFTKQKNHDYLIDLFYKIQLKQPNSVLVLIGEGELYNKIKEKTIKLNISDKVLFLGYREDVNELLNMMDIFLFPSLYEGLCISLIESQTNGLITYVSDNISLETKISPYLNYFNLSDTDIVDRIINSKKIDRVNAYKYTIKSKFDIKNTVNELEKIYHDSNDLITVIINVYNGEEYIERCINCAINQTYKNIEILVVNDASTDNTINIIKKFNDKRIRLINNKKNLGLSLSRNVGIDNAKGKYLYFVDVDDFILEDTIEYLYRLIKKHNVLLSTCECKQIRKTKYTLKNTKEKVSVLSGKNLLDKVLLSKNRHISTWNKLYDKSIFDNLRFEARPANDVALTYKIALNLDKYVYSNQVKYICYRHNDSIMGTKKPKWCIDLYDAAIERYNYIKNIYPKYLKNNISFLATVVYLSEHPSPEIAEHLKKNNAYDIYKKLFSFKIIFYDFKFKVKIKMILLRISPKLFEKVYNVYVSRKRVVKKWKKHTKI